MRNAISFFKHYRRQLGLSSIPAVRRPAPRRRPRLLVVASLVVAGLGLLAASARASLDTAPLALPGRPAPELAAIFVPRHAPPGSYRVTVLDVPIERAREQAMAALAPGSREGDPPGAWTVERVDPLSAFGEAGLYDRSRVARLYSGKPASVLHAPIVREGRVAASLTLIAPYPDPKLERLVPGTLAILFVADAARQDETRR